MFRLVLLPYLFLAAFPVMEASVGLLDETADATSQMYLRDTLENGLKSLSDSRTRPDAEAALGRLGWQKGNRFAWGTHHRTHMWTFHFPSFELPTLGTLRRVADQIDSAPGLHPVGLQNNLGKWVATEARAPWRRRLDSDDPDMVYQVTSVSVDLALYKNLMGDEYERREDREYPSIFGMPAPWTFDLFGMGQNLAGISLWSASAAIMSPTKSTFLGPRRDLQHMVMENLGLPSHRGPLGTTCRELHGMTRTPEFASRIRSRELQCILERGLKSLSRPSVHEVEGELQQLHWRRGGPWEMGTHHATNKWTFDFRTAFPAHELPTLRELLAVSSQIDADLPVEQPKNKLNEFMNMERYRAAAAAGEDFTVERVTIDLALYPTLYPHLDRSYYTGPLARMPAPWTCSLRGMGQGFVGVSLWSDAITMLP